MKLKFLVVSVIFLAVGGSAFGQGAFVSGSAQGTVNGALRSLAGATVTVCAANTTGIPCSPPSANTLFKDQALTQPLANPTTTDSNGNYNFAVAAGTYALTITATGFTGSTQQITVTCGTGGCTATSLTVTGATTLGSLTVSGTGTLANTNNIIWLDGVTNPQTAAGLNAALVAAGSTKEVWVPSTAATLSDAVINVPKGGVLRFLGSQTFTIAGIVVADSSIDTTAIEVIDCPSHAKLKLANAANRDVITDTNFLTLSGSGNIFGTYKFTLRGCVIDGNKVNQNGLVTRTTGTILNVARSAGVSTINFSNSPSCQVGDRVRVDGTSASAFSFNTVAYVQSATASQITYNQSGPGNLAQTASGGTAICYSGPSGVKIYGRSDIIEDNFIANNVLDGLWTEGFQNPAPVDDTGDTDCTIRRNRLMNSGGSGWIFAGPDGCQSSDNTEWGHAQWAREILRAGVRDTVNTSYNNTLGSLHLFGGGIQTSSSQETCQATNCEGILVDSNGGFSTFSSMLVAAGGGVLTGTVGMEVRSTVQSFQGIIQTGGASTTGLKLGNSASAGGGIFSVAMTPISGVSGAANMFDCTSETGNPIIILHGQDTVDTLRGPSCWTGNEELHIGSIGSVTADRFTFQVPGSWIREPCNVAPTLAGGLGYVYYDCTAPRWRFANNGTLDNVVGAATTDTLTNKTLNTPLPSGTGLQVFNTTTTCTTAASVGATCTTAAISLPVAEADTSYRVACTGKGPTAVPVVSSTANSSATQFTITIAALTAVAASFSSYDCVAGHN